MPEASPTEAAVGVAQLARLLDVSKDTIYRLAESGDIPAMRVGRQWRFIASRVLRHLEASNSSAVAESADYSRPTVRARSNRQNEEARRLENVRLALAHLRRIDPDGKLTKEEAARAVMRLFGE